MASPLRQPTKMKALKGTLRESRQTENEMDIDSLQSIPPPPSHFQERAIKEWELVTETLHNIDLLYEEDLPQLQAYCFNVWMLEKSEQELSKQGFLGTYKNKGGHSYVSKNKWISIYNEAIDKVVKLGAQFGFSPTSRTKISMPNQKKSDPLDGF